MQSVEKLTKTCKKCREEKDIDLFGVVSCSNDGHDRYCKKCMNEWKTANRNKKIEYYREMRRSHYLKNKDKIYEDTKKYNKSEKGKEVARRRERKRWITDREKISATGMLRYMVFKGKIKKPDSCSRCGTTNCRICGHHHKGYSMEHRYDVLWLCDNCHNIEHGKTPRTMSSSVVKIL